MSQLIYKPEVTVVSKSELYDIESLDMYTGVSGWEDTCDLDSIPEFAGRTCYQSFANPRPGGNKTYIGHVLESGHGSVLEHSVVTLLITGVSRSLTHELIRHRAGTGFSQLSQRYAGDTHEIKFVVPPLIVDRPEFIDKFLESVLIAKTNYESAVTSYVSVVGDKWVKDNRGATPTRQDLTYTRKKAREAARSLLPNCVETHIVMSGNLRAWRNIIEQRACIHADLEIRRLGVMVGRIMSRLSPNVFQDMEIFGDIDGYESVVFACKKV